MDSRGEYIDAQKLYTLEAFLARDYLQHDKPEPLIQAGRVLDKAYQMLLENVYGQLMLQSHLCELNASLSWKIEDNKIIRDAEKMVQVLESYYDTDPEKYQNTINDLRDVLTYVDTPYTQQIKDALISVSSISGDAFEQTLTIFSYDISRGMLVGTEGSDIINAPLNNTSSLYGLGGDDEIYSGRMEDLLSGNTGDDYLNGSYSNDTYQYLRGDGNDIIYEGSFQGVSDKLKFENVTADEVSVIRDGQDMLLLIAERERGAMDGGSVRLKNQASSALMELGVECVEFADGTRWDQQTLREKMFVAMTTDGDDNIIGSGMNDVLRGGRGDDFLKGSSGNDTYLYALGNGHDIIKEYAFDGDHDMLKFENITPQQIAVKRDGNDVVLEITGSDSEAGENGSVRLVDHATNLNTEEGIEFVEFADGTIWDQSTINDRIQPVQHLLASSPSLLPASDGRLDTVPAGFTAPIQGALWG